MSLVDVHCDLTHPDMEVSPDKQLESARARGVGSAIMVGTDVASWERQWRLAQRRAELHCTYGWHPWWICADLDASPASRMEPLADAVERERPVAIGEAGLDYSRPEWRAAGAHQQDMLRAQLALARERDLPIVLHVVRAHGALLSALQRDGLPSSGGMIHGFSGSVEMAQAYVKLGLHISFSSTLLDARYRKARSACRVVPNHRLLVETDAPDQAARGSRGRGELQDLADVCDCLATLRDESLAHIHDTTARNARALFALPPVAQRSLPEAAT